jgi:hypothetical protein
MQHVKSNPKPEIRNPKETRNLNTETQKLALFYFRIWFVLEFISHFGFLSRDPSPDGSFQAQGEAEQHKRRQAEPRIRFVIPAILEALHIAALQGVDGSAGTQ